jgi:putative sterol carrier protein
VVRYLSLSWLEALTQAIADRAAVAAVPIDQPIGVTQVVTKGPEGTIVYHLQVDNDGVRFGPGPADPEDVRFEQKWKTAVGVATGKLPAPEAFLKGLIRLSGDRDKLIAAQPVMASLEPIFATVREQTEYA